MLLSNLFLGSNFSEETIARMWFYKYVAELEDGGRNEGDLLKEKELDPLTFLSEVGGKVTCRECELGLRLVLWNSCCGDQKAGQTRDLWKGAPSTLRVLLKLEATHF